MAANTERQVTLNARDWRTIIGLVHGSPYADYHNLELAFIAYQNTNGVQNAGAAVTLTVKDKTLYRLAAMMQTGTMNYVHRYNFTGNSLSPFTRICDKIKATAAANSALVPADPWLTDKLVILDAVNDAQIDRVRNNGGNYTTLQPDVGED